MRKYESKQALEAAMEQYFAQCDEKGLLYGEAGLALHLGVPLETLRGWYDGRGNRSGFHAAARTAYLRMQAQIESDSRYHERSMVTRGMFLNKQPRFGAYQERGEGKQELTLHVKLGRGMEKSDFQ